MKSPPTPLATTPLHGLVNDLLSSINELPDVAKSAAPTSNSSSFNVHAFVNTPAANSIRPAGRCLSSSSPSSSSSTPPPPPLCSSPIRPPAEDSPAARAIARQREKQRIWREQEEQKQYGHKEQKEHHEYKADDPLLPPPPPPPPLPPLPLPPPPAAAGAPDFSSATSIAGLSREYALKGYFKQQIAVLNAANEAAAKGDEERLSLQVKLKVARRSAARAQETAQAANVKAREALQLAAVKASQAERDAAATVQREVRQSTFSLLYCCTFICT